MLRVIAQKWGDNLCFLWGQSDWFCQQRQGGFEKTDFFSSVLFPQINELCQCCHACRYNMWSCSFVVSQAMCLTLCCRRTSGIDERRLTQTMASFIREKLYVAQHQVISIQILSNPIYRLGKKKNPYKHIGLDLILLTMCKVYISSCLWQLNISIINECT